MLVAIDTSTNQSGLACYEERGLLAEYSWDSGRDHTAQLLPQLTGMLQNLHRTRAAITAIGVALGPGSWSGLRVGLSTAKGLALALNLPVVGIGTLDALEYQFANSGMPVVPIVRLGRDRFAASALAGGPPRNTTLAELCAETGVATLFCGDIDGEVRTELRQQLGERARFPTSARAMRRPGFLAELAWRRFQTGEYDLIATLEPIYLGQPVRLAQA
jgi:tRNA threonylcarbamoyladenosine biosynthesis protein TsaB